MTAETRGQAAYEALRDFYWNRMETLESADARYAYVSYGDLQKLEELFVAALPDVAAAQEPHAATALPREQWAERKSAPELADSRPATMLQPVDFDDEPEDEGNLRHVVPASAAAAAMAALTKVVESHERVMYAAAIDIRHGQPGTARRLLGEELDGWDGPEWDGTETGAQYLKRTRGDS